eukprot:3934371-Rhodomonas_salina.1
MGGSNRYGQLSAPFQLVSAWNSIDQTEGSVLGGLEMVVSGAGFNQDFNYTCLFRFGNFSTGTTTDVFSCATFQNSSRVSCETPAWPIQADEVEFSLVEDDSLQITFSGEEPSGTVFRFNEILVSVIPVNASATGGQVVVVSGFGFDGTSEQGFYKCVWSEDELEADVNGTCLCAWADGANSSLVCSGAQQTALLASQFTNASVQNLTSMACPVPEWGLTLEAGNTRLQVVRDCRFVYTAAGDASLAFEMYDSWRSAAPTSDVIYSHLESTVEVVGRGFTNSSGGDYACTLTNPVTGDSVASTGSVVVNTTLLRCFVPVWPYRVGSGVNANVTLTRGGGAVDFDGDNMARL